jgi:hypothetical protein
MGWSGIKNGALLQRVQADTFEVFISVDRHIKNQQNLQGLRFAILVLVADSNRTDHLLPLIPALNTALASVKPGDYVEIGP